MTSRRFAVLAFLIACLSLGAAVAVPALAGDPWTDPDTLAASGTTEGPAPVTITLTQVGGGDLLLVKANVAFARENQDGPVVSRLVVTTDGYWHYVENSLDDIRGALER